VFEANAEPSLARAATDVVNSAFSALPTRLASIRPIWWLPSATPNSSSGTSHRGRRGPVGRTTAGFRYRSRDHRGSRSRSTKSSRTNSDTQSWLALRQAASPARLNEGLAQQFDGTDVSARSGDENTRPTDTAESPRGWIRDAVTLPRHKSRRTRVFWPSTSWLDDRLSAGCGCHRSAGGHPSTT
jgi:hypothetical protein